MIATNAVLRRDPTRTATLRRQYVRELTGRFRRVAALIRQTIVDNDALFLEPERRLPLATSQATAAGRFTFPRDQGKVAAFMDWLRGVIDGEVLQLVEGDGQRVTGRGAFQNVFIRRAYASGAERAETELRRAGFDIAAGEVAAFLSSPRSVDAIQLLFTRNFEALKGIGDEMSRQIARELGDGLIQGLGNKEIARRLVDRVDKIGMTRARILVATEVNRAYNEGALNRMESMGVEGVEAQVEWATALDPCPICEPMEGKVFSVREAHGVLPRHPRCKCTWLPVAITANQATYLAIAGIVGDKFLAGIR